MGMAYTRRRVSGSMSLAAAAKSLAEDLVSVVETDCMMDRHLSGRERQKTVTRDCLTV